MRTRTGLPSSLIMSPTCTRWPTWAAALFTVRRPSAMKRSISRREPRPAWASTLCSLGDCASGCSTRLGAAGAASCSWAAPSSWAQSASIWPDTMSAKSYSACRGAVAGARGVVRRRSGLLLPRLVALGLLRLLGLLPLAGRRRAPAAARGLREGRDMVRKSEKMMKNLHSRHRWRAADGVSGGGRFQRHAILGKQVGGKGCGCGWSGLLGRIARLLQGGQQRLLLGGVALRIEQGQIGQRAQTQIVEKLARRGQQGRAAYGFAVADFFDPATVFELFDDLAAHGDAANVFNVAARDGLTVGNDGQRLQHRAAVARRLVGVQAIEVVAHFGAGLKTPARGHAHQLHTTALPLGLQVLQALFDVGAVQRT